MSSKHKKRNWVLLLIIVLLMLLGAALVFRESIRNQFKNMLQEQLDAALPPEYAVNFDDLALDFQEQVIHLTGFKLNPDISLSPKRSYQIHIPDLEIQINSFWEAIFERSLMIDRIWINNPALVINVNSKEEVKSNFSNESFSLLEVIQASLAHLEVGDLEIKEAEVSYHDHRRQARNNLILDGVNLLVTDFSLDSNRQAKEFFNAAEILLRVSGDTFLLSDQNHELSFGNLELSLKDSILNLSDIRLQPLLQNANKRTARIDLQTPLVSFSGINFKKSYLEKNLQLDRLYIHEPQFDFKENPTLLRTKKEKSALQLALERLAGGIKIKEIVLDNAGIDLNFIKRQEREVQFGVDSIVIHQFELNETTRLFDGNLPFADVEFVLRDIRQELPGNFLGIEIQKAVFSTILEQITLQEIKVGKEGKRSSFFQSIPYVALSGLDIFSALQSNRVEVDELFIDRPLTTLQIGQKGYKNESRRNDLLTGIAIFFQKFFFKEINAKRLHIQDGALRYNEQFSIDSIHYAGNNIILNERVENWSEIFSDFELELENIVLDNDTLNLQVNSYLTNGISHTVDSCSLQWLNGGDTIAGFFPSISLSTIDLDTLFTGFLQVDSLIFPNAKASVNLNDVSSRENPDIKKGRPSLPLDITHFIATNLDLSFQDEQDLELVGRFDFLSGSIQDTVLIDFFRFRELEFSAVDFPYNLEIGLLEKQSSRSDYQFEGIYLLPKNERTGQDSSMYLDRLRIWDLDLEKGLKTQEWESRKIILNDVKAAINLAPIFNQEELTRANQSNYPIFVIDTFLVFNGALSAYDQSQESLIDVPEISIAVYDLNTLRLSSWEDVYGGLIVEALQGLKFENKDWHLIQDNIIFNADYELLILENVLLERKTANPLRSIRFNSLAINGFKPIEILESGVFNFQAIKVDNTSLTVSISESEHQQTLQVKLPKINLEELELSNIDLNFIERENLMLDGISLAANKLNLDSTFSLNRVDDFIGSISVGIDTIHYELGGNGAYDVGLKLDYQSGANGLRIEDFRLIKNLADTSFSQQLEYRQDYWDIYAREILVPQLPLATLFSKPLIIPKLTIEGMLANDFNDERIPLKPANKPLPHQQLKKIAYPFHLDSLHIKGDLRYDAKASLSGNLSWITLNNMDLQLHNLSNMPEFFPEGIQVQGKGELYNAAPFQVNLDFDMLDSLSSFKMEGSVDNLNLALLNPMLRPQAAVQINRGNSRRILFNLAANDEVAVGDMLFRYKRLRVQLLDKEDVNNSNFGNSFLSFWANRLVSSNNPSWLRRRKGTIYFERDQQKAISHFWVHSLLSGVVSSVGVKNNKRKLKKSGIPHLEEMDYQRLYKQELSKLKKDNKDN